jgi:hypothetical protein
VQETHADAERGALPCGSAGSAASDVRNAPPLRARAPLEKPPRSATQLTAEAPLPPIAYAARPRDASRGSAHTSAGSGEALGLTLAVIDEEVVKGDADVLALAVVDGEGDGEALPLADTDGDVVYCDAEALGVGDCEAHSYKAMAAMSASASVRGYRRMLSMSPEKYPG